MANVRVPHHPPKLRKVIYGGLREIHETSSSDGRQWTSETTAQVDQYGNRISSNTESAESANHMGENAQCRVHGTADTTHPASVITCSSCESVVIYPVIPSPREHLTTLKSIHRKARTRRRLHQLKTAIKFIVTTLLPSAAALAGITLMLTGYFYQVRILLGSGCILLLAAVGFAIQVCFSNRSSPNKFVPMAVPFSIAAEDLKEAAMSSTLGKPISNQAEESGQQIRTQVNDTPGGNMEELEARRLSLARTRVMNTTISHTRHALNDQHSGVLGLARRLTMASSAIAWTGEDGLLPNGSTWSTGADIRHGVRRSLAWNATGASRFYERSYY